MYGDMCGTKHPIIGMLFVKYENKVAIDTPFNPCHNRGIIRPGLRGVFITKLSFRKEEVVSI